MQKFFSGAHVSAELCSDCYPRSGLYVSVRNVSSSHFFLAVNLKC